MLSSIASARRFCAQAPRPLILVPTMGALHDGHVALIRRAHQLAGQTGSVAVSIFVNPTQFGPREDFASYPRPIKSDLKLCRAYEVDMVFNPSENQMYASDHSTFVEEAQLSRGLCGQARPGHFRGVCTVVTKLLSILAPDAAVFGQKDYQQLMVIRRLVRDLALPVRIVPVETVREPDGLAISSRNAHLSDEERRQAPEIRRSLLSAAKAAKAGGNNPAILKKIAAQNLASEAPLARLDYLEMVEPQSLQPAGADWHEAVIAIAVFFGQTRLIDNIRLRRE